MLRALLISGMLIGSVYVAIVATITLWSMLHAWRTPEAVTAAGFGQQPVEPRHFFSLIVPARHEERVLEPTLVRLLATDHPHFEVVVVVGDDDASTRTVAEDVSRRAPGRVRVVVDHNLSKSKPKALNTALPHCRGDIVGIFDAEDEVHPALLLHVDHCFQDSGIDVVQGGVQLMNYRTSWFSLRNVLEYFFWYKSRLHLQARRRFVPLGGNTVFVRAALLRTVGGWDPHCLAEDCDLGVRLSVLGARVKVAYDPGLVTREETPLTLGALVRQRTRWNQGFLQVLRKGEWRKLSSRGQRMIALWTLATPFLQALIGLTVAPFIAGMLFLKAPILLALLTFAPALLLLTTLAVEMAALGEFCSAYGWRPSWIDYLRLSLGTPLYNSVLAFAAVRAVLREMRGVRNWEKTAHVGAHRADSPTVAFTSSPSPAEVVRELEPVAYLGPPEPENSPPIQVAGVQAPQFGRAAGNGSTGGEPFPGVDLTVRLFHLAHVVRSQSRGRKTQVRPDLIHRTSSVLTWCSFHHEEQSPEAAGSPGGVLGQGGVG